MRLLAPAGAVNAALGAISAAATGEEADAATSYLDLLIERMAANDDDEDDDEDANDVKGRGGGEVDGKDAMPVVLTERGQQHGIHVR